MNVASVTVSAMIQGLKGRTAAGRLTEAAAFGIEFRSGVDSRLAMTSS